MQDFPSLNEVQTPALVVDRSRLAHNAARVRAHVESLAAESTPLMKTGKTIDAARFLQTEPRIPLAVSTMREAEESSLAGARDIIYAVGIAPDKLSRVATMRRQDVDLTVILDSVAQVDAVLAAQELHAVQFTVLLEVDSDGVRAGLQPDDPLLARLADRL